MFFANFLIALREGVEAALIVGILVGYLTKVGRRDVLPKLWLGVAIAAAIPLAVGAFMTWGPYTLSFQAQEIIGGTLSLLAAGMVTWMIFWMGSHGATMASSLTSQADAALGDDRGAWGIVWLAILSVGREGLETAVFVWATVRGGAASGVTEPFLGVIAGLVVAVVIGWLVYRGTTRINLRAFFTITGLFLIFVAAGIISYGIGDLQEANILPGWGTSIYDISRFFDGHISWLTPNAWWFVLLEAVFQVNLSPTHLQFFGWLTYLLIVLPAFWWHTRKPRQTASSQSPVSVPNRVPTA